MAATLTVTYTVQIRKPGTGNKWVDYHRPSDSFDKAIEQLREAVASYSEAKIKQRTTVNQF